MTDSEVYNNLCDSYRAIDEFRTKLLGFLPLVTAGGIFGLLAKDVALTPDKQILLEPVAIFSVLITMGLYAYELYGITKCHYLIETGKYLESKAQVHGQFATRPGPALRVLHEPFAAAVIYPAVLAAWAFMVVGVRHWKIGLTIAMVAFLASFSTTMMYTHRLPKRWSNDHPALKLRQEG